MSSDPRNLSVIGSSLLTPFLQVASMGGDGPRVGLQYRRAKTAASAEQYADLRQARKNAASAGSGLDRGQVRRSAVSLSSGEPREGSAPVGRRSGGGEEGRGRDSQASDVPIAHRTLEERLANPDRLSLDRRGFTGCPRLEGEENLRLLNLQHNLIVQVRNLCVLRKLIFLDLYDNRIERISGLSALRSLRVLMLGKNRISGIEGLECLEKLDVLDLHGNEIEEISNMAHLTELRVLNLAGNRIRAVRGLLGMRSLTELNLRRNRIDLVQEVDQLPLLERIFLSHNDICSWAQIEAVAKSRSITELTLDGNLLAREMHYRFAAIHQLSQIRSLDMKRISDEERRLALAWSRREEEKKKEMSRIAAIKEKRRQALSQAKKQWELSHASLWNRTGRVMRIPDLYSMHVSRLPDANDDAAEQTLDDSATTQSLLDPTQTTVAPEGSWSRTQARTAVESVFADLSRTSIPNPPPTPNQIPHGAAFNTTDSGIDSSIKTNESCEMEFDEVDGACRKRTFPADPPGSADCLQPLGQAEEGPGPQLHVAEVVGSDLILYGLGAFASIDNLAMKELGASISGIVFRYVAFDDIIRNISKLRARFPNITSLTFAATSITTFAQLGQLGQIKRIDSVTVAPEGNPVTGQQLWRPFLLSRMAHTHIRRLNGAEVTDKDWALARALFHGLEADRRLQAPAEVQQTRQERAEVAAATAEAVVREWADGCLRADGHRTFLGRAWAQVWRDQVREATRTVLRAEADLPP